VGGFVGTAGFGIYNAAKFAVEGFSEALALEVAPLGIRVTIVEPGALRTDGADRSMDWAERVIDDYAESSGRTRQNVAGMGGRQSGDPVRAARAIVAVVESPQPPLRLVLGEDALREIRGKLARVTQELEDWEATTLGTAFAQRVGDEEGHVPLENEP
jgi:NAD(P)-dependent dehydrogenase (short-subunit alcohol dehydrogenase family)